MLKAVDFGFKRSRIRGTGSAFLYFGNSCQLVNKNKNHNSLFENYSDNIKLQYIA